MSKRYPGGLITKTPVTPTPSSAPGIWTLEQQLQARQAGTWPSGGPFNYIEDVFSTWLYTGTGATQTITNNINLSGNGGLVWIKSRSAATNHNLFDTAQGATKLLHSNTTGDTVTDANSLTAFGTTGFTLGSGNTAGNQVNTSSATYASWTFRKQPKFFDVVTYTGNCYSPGDTQAISHNLGSVPGMIIVKCTNNIAAQWAVYHRSQNNGTDAQNYILTLNDTTANVGPNTSFWGGTAPTSTAFTVGYYGGTGFGGRPYVAYLFAHNAGGFGLTGSDNVISCGSYTGNGSATGPVITLGYEPQWVLIKNASDAQNWYLIDNMRGMPVGSADANLIPNLSDEESNPTVLSPTATGFQLNTTGSPNQNGNTFIYIAIRRGPMKVPTVGTSVFGPLAYTANNTTTPLSSFGPIDMYFATYRNKGTTGYGWWLSDRVRGNKALMPAGDAQYGFQGTSAEIDETTVEFANSVGLTPSGNNSYYAINASPITGIGTPTYTVQVFRRAPGFFDVVCYTGTGTSALAVTHNLQAVPQLIITKQRSATRRWQVYSVTTGASAYLVLNTTAASTGSSSMWNATTPTSTTFTVGDIGDNNVSGGTYVAYLFATCPGVSKVGSYSGTGATQTIDCGFTGGARFVLIKRTYTTGDWYVWDTARGMVAGTDPSILLNSTAAEVNANSVYTTGVGFQIVSTAAGINASGGTYIFLAIA